MSKSFKKVVACLLAVLMVMFSVPFTAFAAVDTTEYTPDVQLQFGTLFQADGDNAAAWIDNYSEDYIENMKGKNATYDFALSGVSGPQLKATGTVSNDAKYTVTGLTLEAADTANVADTAGNDDYELDGISTDHALKAGDAFTVTVRMDNVSQVYVATAEIGFSGNIEPLYAVTNGSGKSMTYNTGTAAQLAAEFDAFDADDADSYELGTHAIAEFDAQALYNGINADEIGSEIRTDVNTGETYMYAEIVAPDGASWSPVAKSTQCIDEDGNVTTMANKSVMCTFAFVLKEDISAANPINFWVHNGNTKGHNQDEAGTYTALAEGLYKPTTENDNDASATTYSENLFNGTTGKPFTAETENFGSKKMTFMGKNENVESSEPECQHANTTTTQEDVVPATCTEAGSYTEVVTCDDCGEVVSRTEGVVIPAKNHNYVGVVTNPTCTEQGYTTYTCANGCGSSYVADYTDPTGHKWGEWTVTTPEVPATCTEDGTTAIETRVCENDATHIETQGGAVIPAKNHAYELASIDWDTLNTETGIVTGNYVCANDANHTTTGDLQTTFEVIQQQTEDDPEITRFTYAVGEFDEYRDVQTKAAAGHTTHNYTVPVSIAWDGDDAVTATVTLKCNKCDATTTTAATVTSVDKTPATCTAAKVVTYTASYDGLDSISKDVSVGAPAGHKLTKTDAVPATCTEAGTEAYWTCSECHKMFSDENAQNEIAEPVAIPAKDHAWGNWTVVTEPTASTKGVEQRVCANDPTHVETRDIDPLGVNITIPKYFVGEVAINGEVVDGTAATTKNVPFGTEYTLEVTDGKDYFKGWEMNGKVVSESTTYKTTAYADITVEPVFEVADANTITVVFFDNFGNKVKEYSNMEVDAYQEAILADGIPTAPSYPSSRFVEWDTDDDTIFGLTTSKTIWGVYEDVESTVKYTVTVQTETGDDITDTALDAAGFTNGEIPYDTKVTVSNDNAKGWAINGVTVSTADTYSFFVGHDVTIVMLTDVEQVPTTTIIGANTLEGYTYNRYNIVATRNVPAGYELIDYGFVYGKNMVTTDLVLENEGNPGTGNNSGNVKVTRAGTKNTSSNEFALNYGIKSAGNEVCARSFIAVKKGTDVQVIYSDMFTINS